MASQKLTMEQRRKKRQPLLLVWSPAINEAISNLRHETHDGQEYAEDRSIALELMDEIESEGFFTAYILRTPRDKVPRECNISDQSNGEYYSGMGATMALAICAAYMCYREANPKEGFGDCDERCANAVSAVCHCVCGGANHGRNLKQ